MFNQPFLVPSVVIGLLAIPLIFRLIPQNRIYGVRTRKTIADVATWYSINRAAGIFLVISSAVYLGFAWLCPMVGQHDSRFGLWLLHLGVFAAPLIAGVLWLRKFAKSNEENK